MLPVLVAPSEALRPQSNPICLCNHAAQIRACDAPGDFPKGFVCPRVHIGPVPVSALLGLCPWSISFVFCSPPVKLLLSLSGRIALKTVNNVILNGTHMSPMLALRRTHAASARPDNLSVWGERIFARAARCLASSYSIEHDFPRRIELLQQVKVPNVAGQHRTSVDTALLETRGGYGEAGLRLTRCLGTLKPQVHEPFQGSTISRPQSSKSATLRVASLAPRTWAMAAICASAWLIGLPSARR